MSFIGSNRLLRHYGILFSFKKWSFSLLKAREIWEEGMKSMYCGCDIVSGVENWGMECIFLQNAERKSIIGMFEEESLMRR